MSQQPIQPQTKYKLESIITLLREVSHDLNERKPFWSKLCFSLAAAFENAIEEHFKQFEFDSPQPSHTYAAWHDDRGERQQTHIWHSATFTINEDA